MSYNYECTQAKPYTTDNVQALLQEIWSKNDDSKAKLSFTVTHTDCGHT